MGDVEQTLARQAYSMRQPMPERIQNAPELNAGLELFLEAFFELDTERTEGAIPWSSVVRYAEVYQFEEVQFGDLLHHLRTLDPVLMKYRSKKAEERIKRNAPKKGGGSRKGRR